MSQLEQENDELRLELTRAGESGATVQQLQEQIQQMMQVHEKELSELQVMLDTAEQEKETAEEVSTFFSIVFPSLPRSFPSRQAS